MIAGLSATLLITIGAIRLLLIRQLALGASLLALIMGVLSCLSFDKTNLGFQFLALVNHIASYNLSLSLGIDGLSMSFLLLTLFVFPVLFLAA